MIRCLFLCLILASNIIYSQQTDIVDFKRAYASLQVYPESSEIVGKVSYTLETLKSTDSIYLDAQHMAFSKVKINSENGNVAKLKHRNDGKRLWFKYKFEKGKTYQLNFEYSASPKKALYFIGWDNDETVLSSMNELTLLDLDEIALKKYKDRNQVWTQGQGKYTSNWFPSLDDVNDKIEFDLSISAKAPYQVIANGALVRFEQVKDSDYFQWSYDMKHPMSSYLLAFVVGHYNLKRETSKTNVPLELYYYPEDSLKVESTYRYSKRMFDFLEEEIGYPYPWQNYKQVPVHDFLYAGMENTSLTIFSDAFVVDDTGFNDKNYVNVNAHELAHQWFGDLVTAASGEHHWLQEGFATYYALLAEKDIFGKNYYIWQLYKSAQDLMLQDQANQGSSLLNPKASSLTFYQRGAWVIHMLRQAIGEDNFKRSVENYLNKFAFKSATTADFINEVEAVSGYDMTDFVNTWIKAEQFPYDLAMDHLKAKSFFIQEYLMADCEMKNSKCDYYLGSGISDEAKSKIIAQVPERITKAHFKNSVKVRQAIAQNLKTIPKRLKKDYESLLNDASYITVETALYNLWSNFPEDRVKYLDLTKDVKGFKDLNIRQLWLVLALSTPNFMDDEKQQFYDELVSYSSNSYAFDTRQMAFKYLNSIGVFNEAALANLKEAKTHHNWRLKKYAKQLIELLSQDPQKKAILDKH